MTDRDRQSVWRRGQNLMYTSRRSDSWRTQPNPPLGSAVEWCQS